MAHCGKAVPALFVPCLTGALTTPLLLAQAPIQVGVPEPMLLDLRDADARTLVPVDARDPAQVESAGRAWLSRIEPFRGAPSIRILLPRTGPRLPLLLAASQALRAQDPVKKLFIAFDAEGPSLVDETAWGAVDGGALLGSELGGNPGLWRDRLAKAQESFPGRPWFLWLPADPGAEASTILGDGGHIIVPRGGPAARLAAVLPPEFTEVEGGNGDLMLRKRGGQGARRWRFLNGEWASAELPKERTEVAVSAADAYDVGALLAKMRAEQLRSRAAQRSLKARLDVDLHMQGTRSMGADLGFTFKYFERAGETPELLQEQVRFNGVTANLKGEVQLPIVESRTSLAAPVALSLTERYRYRDGGPEGPNLRNIRFDPVDQDATLFRGEVVVEESTGRVIEERSERANLPGTVKSERRILSYGEAAPGVWRVLRTQTFERWVSPGGVAQVQRKLVLTNLDINGPGFDAEREAARRSTQTMLKESPEGIRYFTRQADGTRKMEEKPRSSGRAIAGVIVVDPGLKPPVLPLAGLVYYDFNAFDRGIQINALTALLFNTAAVAIPRLPGGFNLNLDSTALLYPAGERPVINGKLSGKDEVARRFATLNLNLGHDLGKGFRFEAMARFEYDRYSETSDDGARTPGFALPPSGLTKELRGELGWLYRGFQIQGFYGKGQRPEGVYGTPDDPQSVPDEGRFTRWGGNVGYDHQLGNGLWLHGSGGLVGGRGFDRFMALNFNGIVSGMRSNSITADRIAYARLGAVLPAGPNLRLSVFLDHGRARSLDDQKTYGLTGLGIAGDLPGFWWFTALRLNLGIGLKSDIEGVKTVNGFIALLRVF
ncbi:MAG: hypothetical protein IPQ13_08480 [Holophagaceae bacterium]|nr:hypothetical protein [Holophagaceae bacterium]